MRPFKDFALQYKAAGWNNPLPIPERKKSPPPKDSIGHFAKPVTAELLGKWMRNDTYENSNIGLRLDSLGKLEDRSDLDAETEWEVLVIDVDHHDEKRGLDQLKELCKRYGKLPKTWTTSARSNSKSGCRYYLVPARLDWMGKASDSIDIVHPRLRYVATYPSIHPDGMTYRWYKPGISPDGVNYTDEIPDPTTFPKLPDAWIDYLSRNRLPLLDIPRDMDSSNKQMLLWAKNVFPKSQDRCPTMDLAFERWLDKIKDSPDSHPILNDGLYNLLLLGGKERHGGWLGVIKAFESAWYDEALKRGKRTPGEAESEINRSRDGALRRIKGAYDQCKASGVSYFDRRDPCVLDENWVNLVTPDNNSNEVESYERNDTSMARFFIDEYGSSVKYLPELKSWMIWTGQTWQVDKFGSISELFDMCVFKFRDRAKHFIAAQEKYLRQPGTSENDQQYKAMELLRKKCKNIYDAYSNVGKIEAALKRASQIPGVTMSFNDLNPDDYILAIPDGKILRLDPYRKTPDAEGFSVERNRKEYLTTQNTHVEYLPSKKLKMTPQYQTWCDTLDLLVPNKELQRDLRKIIGYSLIGGNPAKKIFFLVGPPHTGKSTMLNALGAMLGDYAGPFNPAKIFASDDGGPSPEMADVIQCNAIHGSEVGRARLDAEAVKKLTGREPITTRQLYVNQMIKMIPRFKVYLGSNSAPTIYGDDLGLRNRIIVFPFERIVTADKDDKDATTRIPIECKEAVFAWAAYGYRDAVREGIELEDLHVDIRRATGDFTSNLSDIGSFLAEFCETMLPIDIAKYDNRPPALSEYLDGFWTHSHKELYGAYNETIGSDTKNPLSPRKFAAAVRGLGYRLEQRKIDGKNEKRWQGIKIDREKIHDYTSGRIV